MGKTIFIGITDSETAYPYYPAWVNGGDTRIEIIRLTPQTFEDIHRCSGVVLSGGVDMHPRFYGSDRIDYPRAPEQFDEHRDRFETAVFEKTQLMNLPLLAICRGMQLVNVCLGGTLIQDLEEIRKGNHRKVDGKDGVHHIDIQKDSLTKDLAGNVSDVVNSAHHQGLDRLADDLFVSAWSPDGVPEAVEWKSPGRKAFFLGVQWHPERVLNALPEDVFGQKIRAAFLDAAHNY